MITILIKTPEGKLHAEQVDILATHDKDFEGPEKYRSGCVFRSLTGRSFFLPFERFSFYIGKAA